MLLGIMYCASNPEVKSQKFYELCQLDLNTIMHRNDPEYNDYFPKLLQISYEFIIRMYIKFRVWELDTVEIQEEDMVLNTQ